jgi:LuxR family maltose regulon positive regulatory protein
LYLREWELMVLARVRLAEGRPRDALDFLQPLAVSASAAGRISRLIEMLILQALAHKALGDLDTALQALGRAVTLAEPARLVRTFADAGPAIRPLLALLSLKTSHHDPVALTTVGAPAPGTSTDSTADRLADAAELNYLQALVAAFETDASHGAQSAEAASPPTGLPTTSQATPSGVHLSPQERRVLTALARGAADKEIGTQLGIKASTAKSHVHRVVSKLGALNRAHAVAIAMDRHLIDPFAEPESEPPEPQPIAVPSTSGNRRTRRSGAPPIRASRPASALDGFGREA